MSAGEVKPVLLTEAQREALGYLKQGYAYAGPELPEYVIQNVTALRMAGLVERTFGDCDAPTFTPQHNGLSAHLSACWWFNITEAGIAALTDGGRDE